MNLQQDHDRSGGVFWFATEKRSRKVAEITQDPRVTLFFANPVTTDHASIFGRAEVVDDTETKARFWSEAWRKFWKNGPGSDDYVMLRVTPESGEFFLNEEVIQGVIDFSKK